MKPSSPPLKVLQLGKFYPVQGGIEATMVSIAKELNLEGKIQCDLLMAHDSKGNLKKNFYGGTLWAEKSLFEAASTKLSPGLFFQLRKIQSRYDIIHIHHPDPMAALALLFSGFKKRIILHWHCDILKQKFSYFFYRFLERRLLKKAESIVCTTQEYADGSKPLRPFQNKLRIVPIGIDSKVEIGDRLLEKKLREKYNNSRNIVSVGRLTHYKGYEYLIRSAKFLPEGYQIFIVGGGKLMDELKNEIQTHGLQERVVLTGRLPEDQMHAYLNFCDLFCFPSVNKVEAYGIAMIEAMQKGKPVVATKIPGSGVSWVNRDKETGINVEPGKSKQLAEAFIKILEDQKLLASYSKNSVKRAKELTTFQMIERIKNIYFSQEKN